MKKIILPNFYESFSCNQILLQEFLTTKPLYGVSGAFPFSIFTGENNNNKYCELVVYEDVINILRSYGPLNDFMIIDCTNLNLILTDYKDSFNKMVFESISDKENVYFSIADINLAEYLIKTYPKVQLILDTNYTIFHSNEEIENVIKKLGNNLKYIIVSNKNLCRKINFPKIYKVFLTECSFCMQYLRCVKQENERILTYSEKSSFENCSLIQQYSANNILTEIKNIPKDIEIVMFSSINKSIEEESYSLLEQVIKEI
mgnify:CR=1 FL=1